MNMDMTSWIIRIPVLLFAITIHECAHGKAALSLGDPSAKQAGRITLNPLRHIDPLGAVCLFLFNFGWAKPVPVDVRFFNNIRRDVTLMSLSGPIANISAAFVAGLFLRYFPLKLEIYLTLMLNMVIMNIGLGIFNLLPIPPLDGSHVLENLLPPVISEKYHTMARFAPIVLISLLILDKYFNTGIVHGIISYPIRWFAHLFIGSHFL